jgi:DNA-binding ferritin-like protein
VQFTKKLLEEAGIEPERLEMFNMSASMGPKFAETADEMTERVRKLGPSPLRNGGHSPETSSVEKISQPEVAVTETNKGEAK